ncbi:hypothetical protein EGH10_20850 [Brevibacillus laterosporus]|uniref:Uncharacterized protein n=1 Tax=Brevibacillus laterosporus LMG 15441 TaxID=1042163 RepID=A0A075R6I0_BRELA|nr:hypothetical protein [Brevibacillus laterosporus]AIG27439.1 hypothetical protein BRLA_c031270 [Brevibacillus laterosporus LMG 15441]RJL15366.1 hypothetical protein DM460_00265 [Brevibacillus laterosporus]TPH06470.1 hypothetical protein EGH10_20850 [Brevibacillus laterosporus]
MSAIMMFVIFVLFAITIYISRKNDTDYVYEREVYDIFKNLKKACKNSSLNNLTKFEQIKECLTRDENVTLEKLSKLLKIINLEENRMLDSTQMGGVAFAIFATGIVGVLSAFLNKPGVNEDSFTFVLLYILMFSGAILLFFTVVLTQKRRVLIIKQVVEEVIQDNVLNNKLVESKSGETNLSYSSAQEKIEREHSIEVV